METDHLSLRIHQKFSEVPRYVSSLEGAVVPQELVDWVRVLPIDLDLSEHWEFDPVGGLGPLLDLSIRAWLLCCKLVAWEGKDLEAFAA